MVFLEYLKKFKTDSINANVFSYGTITGNYLIPMNTLANISLEKNILESYALVEKKTEYYKLIFDIDYKNREQDKDDAKHYIHQTDKITDFIIKNIILVLNETLDNVDTRYLYADKENDFGVHLYFPNVIVDKKLHQYIQNKVFSLCVKNDPFKLNEKIWDKILDKCVAKANGLRLLYYQKDGNYYKPNKNKSTIEIPKNAKELMLLSFIRTEASKYNCQLKIRLEDCDNKKTKKSNKDINKQNLNLNNDSDYDHLELNDKKEMCCELLDLLSIKRIDEYDTWIDLVYFCKNYGLYDDIIKLSKKSLKFNNKAINIINNIFTKKKIPEKYLSIGSLINWAKEDSHFKAINILKKYNTKVKLEIKDTNDFLLYNSNIKYDFTENEKYISDKAKMEMCDSINKKNIRTIVLHAPTGSGKTTATEFIVDYYIKNLLSDNFNLEDCGIISIVTRRSMDATHQNAFKNFNFVSYQKCNEFSNKYISSLEHLKFYDNDKQRYGIVILDEINSLIRYFYSGTLNGRRKECLKNLCHIIQNASLIICCDANITTMVTSFLKLKGNLFGETFYYKNTFKNKLGIRMNIYKFKYVAQPSKENKKYKIKNSKEINIELFKEDKKSSDMHNSENSKIIEFCKLIENDVRNSKSVLIFSDSKDITIKIKEVLMKYNNNESYYKIFNKNEGTTDEIVNCNETFKNHCVICSPKIIYGVDITIKYGNIYCIYKYNDSENSLGSLEYHQQYSRARNTQVVNILILDPFFETKKNYFFTYGEHKKEEYEAFINYKKRHVQLCKKYNVADDLCSQFGINGIEINNDSLFADIHYFKTWIDQLFSANKFQLVLQIAKEQGYDIQYNELTITEHNKGLNRCLQKDRTKIKTIIKNIVNGDNDNKNDRIKPNIIEQIDARKKVLKLDDDEIDKKHIDILCDDKKFQAFVNKKYLDLNDDEFNKIAIKLNNNDLAWMAKDNKIICKINVLKTIEKLLGINRYRINNIDKDINLDNIKNELLKIVDKIIILFEGIESKIKLTKRMTAKINNIKYYDQLQKFMADCYNSFGDIICYEHEFKEKMINGEKNRRNIYFNFMMFD